MTALRRMQYRDNGDDGDNEPADHELSGDAANYLPYEVSDRGQVFHEQFLRGSFDGATSGKDDVALYVEHEKGGPLASTGSGTLRLRDTGASLHLSARLGRDDPGAQQAISRARRGILKGLSIGFYPDKEAWSTDGRHRTISKATLVEVSLVHRPANPAALVGEVRSRDGRRLEVRVTRDLAFAPSRSSNRSTPGPSDLPIHTKRDFGIAVHYADQLTGHLGREIRSELCEIAIGHPGWHVPLSWRRDGARITEIDPSTWADQARAARLLRSDRQGDKAELDRIIARLGRHHTVSSARTAVANARRESAAIETELRQLRRRAR